MHFLIFLILGFGGAAHTFAGSNFVEIKKAPEYPRQSLILAFDGGGSQVAFEDQGAIAVGMSLLNETSPEFFLVNSEVSYEIDDVGFYVTLKTPSEFFENSWAVLKKVLTNFQPTEEQFKLHQARVLGQTRSLFESLSAVLFFWSIRDAYQNQAASLDGAPSPALVQSASVASVKRTFEKLINFKQVQLFSMGPLKPQVLEKWSKANQLKSVSAKSKTKLDVSNLQKPLLALLDWPSSTEVQVGILFGDVNSGDSLCAKERAVALVAHQILGGGISGMLSQSLRVQKGLTYFAGSKPHQSLSHALIWTFGSSKNLEEILKDTDRVIAEFKAMKISTDQLKKAKEARITEFKSENETVQNALVNRLKQKQHGCKAVMTEDHLSQVSAQDIEKFRSSHLNLSQKRLYLVGDSKQILPVLRKLKIEDASIKKVTLDQLR